MNIPLTDIHTSGSSYLNTLPMVNNYNVVALVFAKLIYLSRVTSNYQLFFYGKMYCNIK